jgi:small subunit ribosomal protein S7
VTVTFAGPCLPRGRFSMLPLSRSLTRLRTLASTRSVVSQTPYNKHEFDALLTRFESGTPNVPLPKRVQQQPEVPPAEDPLLRYLASAIVRRGKRAMANRIVSRTLSNVYALTHRPPVPLLREALFKLAPAVRCTSQRHGSKNIVIPIAVGEKQRMKFAVQWLLKASYNSSGKKLEQRLAKEMVAVIQGTSKALEKKKEVHMLAVANRQVYVSRFSMLQNLSKVTGVMLRRERNEYIFNTIISQLSLEEMCDAK